MSLIAILLAVATVQPAAEWVWRGNLAIGGKLDVDLIRGEVVIEEGPETTVRIAAHSASGANDVRFSTTHAGGALMIRDIYPAGQFSPKECLPPTGERGDFWSSDTRLTATITVKPGLMLKVRVMSGDIRVRGVASADLSSNAGRVIRVPDSRSQ